MSKIPVQLPCRHHRGCKFHRHWSSSIVAPETNATSKNSSVVKHSSVPPEGLSTVVNTSPIQCLPTELLQAISAYLLPTEQACLALTCQSLARVFGSQAWTKLSAAREASWFMHEEMLDLLQRDLNSEEYWRCQECLIFHRRSKRGPGDKSNCLTTLKRRLGTTFGRARERARGQNGVRIGVFGDPSIADDDIYLLDGSLVKAIMDRHFLGPSEGQCLNSMRCKGTRTFMFSATARMVLTYEFIPKIVLDRLLLQSTYRFEIQNTMFIRNMSIENIPASAILEGMNFWICGHNHTGGIMGSLGLPRELRTPRKYTDLRCKYCPTQYEVTVIPHEGIRISVWQNLGSGRSGVDRKWQHITSTGERRRRYSRHCEENLYKAFTFVLCSKKEEFETLAAQAEHWQPWYGRPQKENLEYKSLPARLTEWL